MYVVMRHMAASDSLSTSRRRALLVSKPAAHAYFEPPKNPEDGLKPAKTLPAWDAW